MPKLSRMEYGVLRFGSTNVSSSSFGTSTSTIGVEYGAPGIGSGEPYNTQLALKIIF